MAGWIEGGAPGPPKHVFLNSVGSVRSLASRSLTPQSSIGADCQILKPAPAMLFGFRV